MDSSLENIACRVLRVGFAVIVALMMVMGASCGRQTLRHHADDAHFVEVDSLLRGVADLDSLHAMVNGYHESEDVMGEVLACKYYGKRLREHWRIDEAIRYHNQGLELATSVKDTLEMMAALNNIGADYRRLPDLASANKAFLKALKLSDLYGDQEDEEAVLGRIRALNGIGNIELELCNYPVADSVLREALSGELALDNHVGLAVNYDNLGVIKQALGEIDSAWYYYRKSMEYNQLLDGKLGIGVCHLRYGELHELERRFSHAQDEYKQAYDLLKDLDDRWHWLDACLALARVSVKLDERDDARAYLMEADSVAMQSGSVIHQSKAHMIHHDLSLAEGDAHSALQHFARSIELHDSVYGPKKNDELRAQNVDYERTRIMGEMDYLNKDITRLKNLRNLMALLIVLLLVMAGGVIGLLVYAVRVRSRAQRQMRQVEETRSLFFTNVVHQLRTPLTAIMSAIDSIIGNERADGDSEAYSAKQRENVEIIERQGNQLLLLVDRILEVGGVRSAIKEPEWQHGDAVLLLRMLVESYRDNCLDRQVELSYVPHEKEVLIDLVPKYFNTIVGSLLENAVCYSREFGKITVSSQVEGGKFVIRVADDGMGISEAERPYVFKPFFRGAVAERMVEGVGIGLTVVHDMVMALGGTVSVESELDHGSVFTVKLPCRHAAGVTKQLEYVVEPVRSLMTRRHARVDVEHTPEQRRGLPKVLIIEDHRDVAHLVGLALGSGYEVHYADDGEQGLNKANELIPDLIVTDVKMPVMDGCELCRRIRASRHLCHIPVIMLSARNSSQDRIRGIEAGADVYMVKPFAAPELRAWVGKLLDNREILKDVYSNSLSATRDVKAVVVDDIDDADFLRRFDGLVMAQVAPGVARIDLDKVAREFRMGEGQLKRKVQELSGKNVAAYVMGLRMEKAKRLLLEQPDTLIGAVAEQCGFTDVAYFSRVFRQHYSMTPSQVRNGGS